MSYCHYPNRGKTLLNFPEKKLIPCKIGKQLGSGAFGKVFTIYGKPNKIIKLSNAISALRARELEKVFNKLKSASSKYMSKLYDYNFVKINTRYYFYYIAEKLFEADYEATSNLCYDYYEKPSKCEYVKYFNNKKLFHRDVHEYNIMKNKSGRLKLIDLDSFEIY